MTPFILRFTLCTLLYALCLAPSAHARREVEDSEKARLLKTATGETAASSSFQGRLDTTFNPASDPATATVARQDTQEREAREAAALTEFAVTAEETVPKGVRDAVKDELEKEKEDEEEDLTGKLKTRLDGTEKSYLKELQKIPGLEERLRKEAAGIPEILKEEEPGRPASSLRPSLANNPFYFSPEASEQFDDKKPVIVGRLMQQGYSRREAEVLVGDTTSPEEIILRLMQDEEYEYGDASEIVSTS